MVGTRDEPAEVFRLHELGRTRVVREIRRLADVNESVADLVAGRVSTRLVFDLR